MLSTLFFMLVAFLATAVGMLFIVMLLSRHVFAKTR